jgi:hypothetical protein
MKKEEASIRNWDSLKFNNTKKKQKQKQKKGKEDV